MALVYAASKCEAKKKADAARNFNQDPLPNIDSSLLNAADIKQYVANIGMIYPFDESDCKTAKYCGRVGGKCVFWSESGKNVVNLDAKNSIFNLKRNSIAFVPIELDFYLPNYIAVRFNLVIDHVYKGLLLGTGPIIDPGFRGRIWIPLHNLTSNEYTFTHGDKLVWFEFTKTSKPTPETDLLYKEFGGLPAGQDIETYLKEATGGVNTKIMSSIPGSVLEAEKKAQNANRIAWLALASLAVALIINHFTFFNKLQRDVDKLEIQMNSVGQLNKTVITIPPMAVNVSGTVDLKLPHHNPRSETDDASAAVRKDAK